jgi:hypothetical protein
MKQSEKQFAVITGASMGLGKSFANELARKKMNLILISLPGQNLPALARELSEQYEVETRFYETDLSVTGNVMELAAWINNHFRVNLLVNNAGLGGSRSFTEAPAGYINNIVQINVMATSLLTHQLLPNLMEQSRSYILNVSSLAAFTPMGYKTVYPATKAFVRSFSRSLNEELKHSNVFVTVVTPGAMKTSPEITSRIEKQGWLGRLSLLHPDQVARKSIERMFRRDPEITLNPVSWLFLNLTPLWIKLPLMTRAIRREVAA